MPTTATGREPGRRYLCGVTVVRAIPAPFHAAIPAIAGLKYGLLVAIVAGTASVMACLRSKRGPVRYAVWLILAVTASVISFA